MLVMTVLETTDVTSTLCSVTQVLPHSQMLVFVVFHTHTHTHAHHATLKLPPQLQRDSHRSGDSVSEPYLLYLWDCRV